MYTFWRNAEKAREKRSPEKKTVERKAQHIENGFISLTICSMFTHLHCRITHSPGYATRINNISLCTIPSLNLHFRSTKRRKRENSDKRASCTRGDIHVILHIFELSPFRNSPIQTIRIHTICNWIAAMYFVCRVWVGGLVGCFSLNDVVNPLNSRLRMFNRSYGKKVFRFSLHPLFTHFGVMISIL